ncbi:MAG: ubiquinol-cytochrome c reductase iron-sulfur subunit [Herpetosiphonaceae bacterium]|nr:ubiquinol-cytochrome c reductase iron-sulfur subunit [Herpetosiphonaceae bacterium]
MAVETEPKNAGRRVITQAQAEAIQAKAHPEVAPAPPRRFKIKVSRREALAYAFAASTALLLGVEAAGLTAPDPERDPLLKTVVPPDLAAAIPGGFAYPRFKAGQFGGKFTLTKKATEYTLTDDPDLNSNGKFYATKVDKDPGTDQNPKPDNSTGHMIAIYQVCTHLGCLIPYVQSEKRFICPCHGSTFERYSQWVRGPAGRNLDQFLVTVGSDSSIIVDTGTKLTGKTH